jgi:hypothetical protein
MARCSLTRFEDRDVRLMTRFIARRRFAAFAFFQQPPTPSDG